MEIFLLCLAVVVAVVAYRKGKSLGSRLGFRVGRGLRPGKRRS